MFDRQDPMRLIIGLGAAVVLVAMAGVSVFSVREYSASLPSLITVRDKGTDGQELEHCRTITPEQYASDDACRRAWAEQRQRFFRRDHQGSKVSIPSVPAPPSSEPAPETKNKIKALHPTLAPRKD